MKTRAYSSVTAPCTVHVPRDASTPFWFSSAISTSSPSFSRTSNLAQLLGFGPSWEGSSFLCVSLGVVTLTV